MKYNVLMKSCTKSDVNRPILSQITVYNLNLVINTSNFSLDLTQYSTPKNLKCTVLETRRNKKHGKFVNIWNTARCPNLYSLVIEYFQRINLTFPFQYIVIGIFKNVRWHLKMMPYDAHSNIWRVNFKCQQTFPNLEALMHGHDGGRPGDQGADTTYSTYSEINRCAP